MKLSTTSFPVGGRMPADLAFTRHDPETRVTFAGNKNPELSWDEVPEGTRSFVLVCVDVSAPTVGDDVNQPDRTVSVDLPRGDFFHWLMVDIPPELRSIAEGSCSDGVTPRGKQSPAGPEGTRQGVSDYTGWFASDAELGGTYHGYDGPSPPWNDELEHRYHFQLYALDLERLPVEGGFTAADVHAAMELHVLAMVWIEGTYTQNPELL